MANSAYGPYASGYKMPPQAGSNLSGLGYASLGAGAIGAGVSAYAQFAAASYNKKIADFNKKVAQLQAKDAHKRGREASARHRLGVGALMGAQRASLAAQGQDLNDGTALALQLDTAKFGELDALTIRNNASREAWGYQVQATNYGAQGQLAMSQGLYGASATALNGVGQGAMNYFQLKQAGVFDKKGQ